MNLRRREEEVSDVAVTKPRGEGLFESSQWDREQAAPGTSCQEGTNLPDPKINSTLEY